MNRKNFAAIAGAMLGVAANYGYNRHECFMDGRPKASPSFSDKAISLFREPHRELKEFSIKGHKVMAYSRKDAITRLKHQKKI